MNGILNLLKPPSMTSSDAVVILRRLLGEKRIGHAGTLDPEASGVLTLLVGRATRLSDVLMEKDKTYIAELTIGVTTTTQDQCGQVVDMVPDAALDMKQLQGILPRFTGRMMQTPSVYSAIKVDGKKLYDYARAGQDVAINAREVTIHGISLLQQTRPQSVLMRVACGKGTYIRTLCHDLGAALGTGGHCSFLLRERSGPWGLEDCATLEAIETAREAGRAEGLLLPMEAALENMTRVDVLPGFVKDACNGRPLHKTSVEAARTDDTGLVRMYVADELYGLARWTEEWLRVQVTL